MQAAKAGTLDSPVNAFLTFGPGADGGEPEVQVMELTKRQRGLVNGGLELVGRKIKPPEDPSSRAFAMMWCEEEAQVAWDDLHEAEPCICISPDAVTVATRYKRVVCKSLSAACKAGKDLEALVAGLKPDQPLRSVSFEGNAPPSVTAYNILCIGPTAIKEFPRGVGHTAATSPPDVYDAFLARRNAHLVGEANQLITQMLTDIKKDATPDVSTGKKDAATAYKNALMKKVASGPAPQRLPAHAPRLQVYVHEGMQKFINRVREDGGVEVVVIRGDLASTGSFGDMGGIVFQLYYRADLSAF